MRLRTFHAMFGLLLAAVTLGGACTLTTDFDALENHDCGAGFKYCVAVDDCVSRDDPVYGCGADSCVGCSAANAKTMGCDNRQACFVSVCNNGYAQCGHENCDFNTTIDPQHCGTCDTVCPDAAALATKNVTDSVCIASKCTLKCAAGFGDCDGKLNTGCEAQLDGIVTSTNPNGWCGACRTACTSAATCQPSGNTWSCQ